MKVVIAFAKKLRRPRTKGRRLFRRQKDKDEILKSLSISSPVKSPKPRTSTEKIQLTDDDQMSYQNPMAHPISHHIPTMPHLFPIPNPLPPAYDECVKISPEVVSKIFKGPDHFSVDIKTPPPVPKEPSRGRTSQILYRSQLNGLAKRKSVDRNSPPRKRNNAKLAYGNVDDLVALKVQHYALSWWRHFAMLQRAAFLLLLIFGLLLLLGY